METQLHRGHHHHHHEEEDPHSGEKKSVLKKVKDKAKKIKDTIKKHEGGHRRDDIYQQGFQDDDDNDDEVHNDPEVHGAPMYESRESITNLEKPRDRNVGTTDQPGHRPMAPHNTSRVELEEDLHAPTNTPAHVLPSNYQSKVTNPAAAGGKEADVAPLVLQLRNLNVGDHDAAERHVQFAPQSEPENTKLNSKGQESGNTGPGMSIAGKVGETLGPVYDKVTGTGSAVLSKVYGMVGGENGDGSSMKEYLSEKFRPGDEDKALSEVITNALHKKEEKEEKKLGKVTVSKEVAERLGDVGDSKREGEDAVAAGEESSGQGMVERFTDAVGLWLGKSQGVQTAKDSVNQSHVSDASSDSGGGGGAGQGNGSQ